MQIFNWYDPLLIKLWVLYILTINYHLRASYSPNTINIVFHIWDNVMYIKVYVNIIIYLLLQQYVTSCWQIKYKDDLHKNIAVNIILVNTKPLVQFYFISYHKMYKSSKKAFCYSVLLVQYTKHDVKKFKQEYVR